MSKDLTFLAGVGNLVYTDLIGSSVAVETPQQVHYTKPELPSFFHTTGMHRFSLKHQSGVTPQSSALHFF